MDQSPRRDRTRTALVRAGQKLFSERPIEVVSIDDIVQAADVGRGSFYNHFTDKDEFEREIVAEARREMESAIALALAGQTDPAVRTVLGVCVSIRFGHEHPARARLVTRQLLLGGFMQVRQNEGVLSDISQGILARRFVTPSAEIGVLTVLGLATATLIRATELPDIPAKIVLAQQMSAVILRALGLPGEEASAIAAYAAEQGIRLGVTPP